MAWDVLVPWVTPAAMSTLAWLWRSTILQPFNYTLALFGIGPIPWTGDADWARFSGIWFNHMVRAPRFLL